MTLAAALLKITLITQPYTPGIGDAILVQAPDGENMLVDTGIVGPALNKVLDERHIDHLEYLVITHNHFDHYGNAVATIAKFKSSLKEVWHNGMVPNADYVAAALKYGIPVMVPKRGDRKQIGPLELDIMHPVSEYKYLDENNNSLVFKMKYGQFSMLFTGDVEYEADDSLIKAYGNELQSTVYKVAHHGSAKFRDQFINLIAPEMAVCSCRTMPVPSRHLRSLLKKMNVEWLSNRDQKDVTIETSGEPM